MQILVYGYGNPGRQDDGLGIELTERLAEWAFANQISGIEFDCNYQPNIEDAAAIAQKDLVIFIDASTEDIEDFSLRRVESSAKASFSTHEASPGYIVQLSKELFQKEPQVLLLHIKGYEWAFEEGLSERAMQNLDKAFKFMKKLLADPIHAIRLQDGIITS